MTFLLLTFSSLPLLFLQPGQQVNQSFVSQRRVQKVCIVKYFTDNNYAYFITHSSSNGIDHDLFQHGSFHVELFIHYACVHKPCCSMSIVPKGFNVTAHKIFLNFSPPVFETSPDAASSIDVPDVCYICLSSMMEPVELVACRHSYCLQCISQWLSKGDSCPVCKNENTNFQMKRPAGHVPVTQAKDKKETSNNRKSMDKEIN